MTANVLRIPDSTRWHRGGRGFKSHSVHQRLLSHQENSSRPALTLQRNVRSGPFTKRGNLGDCEIVATAATAEFLRMRSLRGPNATQGTGAGRRLARCGGRRVGSSLTCPPVAARYGIAATDRSPPYQSRCPRSLARHPSGPQAIARCGDLHRLHLVTPFPAWQGDVRPSDERSMMR